MSANLSPNLPGNSFARIGGSIWHRLHSERENISEALLKDFRATDSQPGVLQEDVTRAANWRCELLQARLRKIDDALDRLMLGSYGNCCKCDRWIEDSKLEFDPAIAFCIECWQSHQEKLRTDQLTCNHGETERETLPAQTTDVTPALQSIELETLKPFATIYVRTLNSDYRIFLLDPRTGRALVEGNRHFVEPVNAVVNGSTASGAIPKVGWIEVGSRLEMLINGCIVSTSPVQSIRAENQRLCCM